MQMKKILFLTFFLYATSISAQEIQLQVSTNKTKVAAEHLHTIKRHTMYQYGEVSIDDVLSTYLQTFYEYSLGRVSLHCEYRSFFVQRDKWVNSFIAGLSFSVLARDNYYISISPLYRYENANMWQLSAVYGYRYKNFTFNGYFDLYGQNYAYAFSENKIKLYFERCFIGVNLEYSLYDRISKFTPYVMIGITL